MFSQDTFDRVGQLSRDAGLMMAFLAKSADDETWQKVGEGLSTPFLKRMWDIQNSYRKELKSDTP